MRKLLQDESGASVAEFALCMVLIIPMAIYSMFVGEAFMAGIKAQEAEISAGWEATAYLLHAYNGGSRNGLFAGAASTSASRVTQNLADFDSFKATGRQGRTLPISSHTLSSVSCSSRPGDVYGPSLGSSYLARDGLIGCQARVHFRNHFITDALLDVMHRGPKIIPSSIAEFDLCGLGNTVQGCQASQTPGFVVLADDYGLENPNATPIQAQGASNRQYWNVGEAIFGGGPTADGPMGDVIQASDQGNSGGFKLGYMQTIGQTGYVSGWGPSSLHLTPYHEDAHDFTDKTKGVSEKIQGERQSGNYMGKKTRNWNMR